MIFLESRRIQRNQIYTDFVHPPWFVSMASINNSWQWQRETVVTNLNMYQIIIYKYKWCSYIIMIIEIIQPTSLYIKPNCRRNIFRLLYITFRKTRTLLKLNHWLYNANYGVLLNIILWKYGHLNLRAGPLIVWYSKAFSTPRNWKEVAICIICEICDKALSFIELRFPVCIRLNMFLILFESIGGLMDVVYAFLEKS